MNRNTSWRQWLRCPDCRLGNFGGDFAALYCKACGAEFTSLLGRPVLLRHDNALFPPSAYIENPTISEHWTSALRHLVPALSINLSDERVIRSLARMLPTDRTVYVLVVGCGSQRERLESRFATFPQVTLVYSDVDSRANVDCFCDVHDLPFTDASFDAIVTTAVLEHVMYPERAAAEIRRVLMPDGLVYSEMPFMQQVHEGAYDFTRYTLSGHRRLFNGFAEIEAGMVAGPGTALAWAIENLALAFFRSGAARQAIKAVVRTAFFWLKYCDHLLANKPQAMDGASCTYFLGRKIEGHVSDEAIIAAYVGAKHVSHL